VLCAQAARGESRPPNTQIDQQGGEQFNPQPNTHMDQQSAIGATSNTQINNTQIGQQVARGATNNTQIGQQVARGATSKGANRSLWQKTRLNNNNNNNKIEQQQQQQQGLNNNNKIEQGLNKIEQD
jgi:hypothetical protein